MRFEETGGRNHGVKGTGSPDHFIVMSRTAVNSDPENIVSAVQISPEDCFPVTPPHESDSCRHAMVIIPAVFCRGCRMDDTYDLRMIHRFMIQGETEFFRETGCHGIQFFDTQEGIPCIHHRTGPSGDITVFAPGAAPGQQKIDIDHLHFLFLRLLLCSGN